MVPSVMDSPICGMITSVGMKFLLPQNSSGHLIPACFRITPQKHTPMGLYGGSAMVGRAVR
jgi:hypothetical protein